MFNHFSCGPSGQTVTAWWRWKALSESDADVHTHLHALVSVVQSHWKEIRQMWKDKLRVFFLDIKWKILFIHVFYIYHIYLYTYLYVIHFICIYRNFNREGKKLAPAKLTLPNCPLLRERAVGAIGVLCDSNRSEGWQVASHNTAQQRLLEKLLQAWACFALSATE